MQMVTKKLATLPGSIPAIHSTPEALDDDHTSAAMRLEDLRYERAILDFESAVRHERDRMSAEHLENQRTILSEAAE
jgi:hypothetical protein